MIQSRFDRKCLEVDSEYVTKVMECDVSNPNQQFVLTVKGKLLVGSIPGYCFDAGGSKMAPCVEDSEIAMVEQTFHYDASTEQIIGDNGSFCLDYYTDWGYISKYSCHDGRHQKFYLSKLTNSPSLGPP